MNDDNEKRFPSNSYTNRGPHKPEKPEDKKVSPVVKGPVKAAKKSLGRKFAETFLAVDLSSVVQHLVNDVLIPTARDTLSEIIESTKNMLLYGDRNGVRGARDRSRPVAGQPSYSAYWNNRNPRQETERASPRPQPRGLINDLLFDTKQDAQVVLDNMLLRLEEFELVSVSDYYQFSNMPIDYTMQNYGWFNLEEACIMRVSEGWILKLPRPTVL